MPHATTHGRGPPPIKTASSDDASPHTVRTCTASVARQQRAMESTKLSALLLLAMLALSSSPLALAWEKAEPECNSCQGGGSPPSSGTPAGGGLPLPPITIPSVPLPSVPLPPVTGVVTPVVGLVPPVVGPVVGLVPPVVGGLPPISLPPIIGGGGSPKRGHGGRKACPPPPTPTPPTPTPTPSYDTCPIDALKLGACVDILGNEVHIGDANVKCCPLVKGIAGLSAAACLCTAIKAKVLDLSVYVPIALEVLLNCGCAVPPGYKCA